MRLKILLLILFLTSQIEFGHTVLNEIYSQNFETDTVDATWSTYSVSTSPNGIKFNGRFSNQAVTLTITDLPIHDSLTLNYDAYFMGTWDGNEQPDYWEITFDNEPTPSIDATICTEHSNQRQTFPSNKDSGAQNICGTNADPTSKNTIGYIHPNEGVVDDTYRMVHEFPDHSSTSFIVSWRAYGLDGLNDESWGIDNLVITINDLTPVNDGGGNNLLSGNNSGLIIGGVILGGVAIGAVYGILKGNNNSSVYHDTNSVYIVDNVQTNNDKYLDSQVSLVPMGSSIASNTNAIMVQPSAGTRAAFEDPSIKPIDENDDSAIDSKSNGFYKSDAPAPLTTFNFSQPTDGTRDQFASKKSSKSKKKNRSRSRSNSATRKKTERKSGISAISDVTGISDYTIATGAFSSSKSKKSKKRSGSTSSKNSAGSKSSKKRKSSATGRKSTIKRPGSTASAASSGSKAAKVRGTLSPQVGEEPLGITKNKMN